jgi:hypothetical protein
MKRKILWTSVAIAVGWGIAFGVSTALNCVPCTAILTMQKANLPPIYATDVTPTIVWDTPRMDVPEQAPQGKE